MNTAHLGDCLNGCDTCKENYHADFNNIDCDTCGQFIEGAPICNNCGQYETHATDQECPAFNQEIKLFNLGKVKAQLARYGIKSEIMHTGGGCATLYLGDPNAEGFYPVVCGAGIYDPENPDNSEGFADEFFIGRDDDRQAQGFYYKGANDPVKIADQIFDYFMHDKVAN